MSLGLPLSAVPASADPAAPAAVATAGELVLPAAQRAVPTYTRILNAGTSGFLWVQEDDKRLLWTSYATGTTTGLEQQLPQAIRYIDNGRFSYLPYSPPGWYGDGSDTVALYSTKDDGVITSSVTLIQGDGSSGGTAVVPVPAGHKYEGTFGSTVITVSGSYSPVTYNLLRPREGGGVTDTPMTGLPEGAGRISVQDGDATSVLVYYGSSDRDPNHWGIVDLATGVYSALPDRVDSSDNGWRVTGFQLGADSVIRRREDGKADVFDRDDLSAPPRTFDTGSFSSYAEFGVIGDTLLGINPQWTEPEHEYVPRGRPLWALTPDGTGTGTGTDMTKVMDLATSQLVQAPDGSVLVAGAKQNVESGDLDWNVYRIAPGADGTVTRSRLTAVQPVAAQIHGLSLGQRHSQHGRQQHAVRADRHHRRVPQHLAHHAHRGRHPECHQEHRGRSGRPVGRRLRQQRPHAPLHPDVRRRRRPPRPPA